MSVSTYSKISVLTLLAVAFVLLSVDSLHAQAVKKKTALKDVIQTSVTTFDGWQLPVTYYQSNLGKDAPVILLLHGERGNRLIWKAGVAKSLHDQGYAVVTVDLRKHGDSRSVYDEDDSNKSKKSSSKLKKYDYQRMVTQDLEAVKKFLLKEHAEERLNVKKMGIVGADMSAVVALNYAMLDWLKKPYNDAPTLASRTPRGQDIQAIVLLSPIDSIAGMKSGKAVSFLRNPYLGISFLLCVGGSDKTSKRTTDKLYKSLTSSSKNEGRMHLQVYKSMKLHGTGLLDNKLVASSKTRPQILMLGFFNKHLKSRDIAWRSRKSKLND